MLSHLREEVSNSIFKIFFYSSFPSGNANIFTVDQDVLIVLSFPLHFAANRTCCSPPILLRLLFHHSPQKQNMFRPPPPTAPSPPTPVSARAGMPGWVWGVGEGGPVRTGHSQSMSSYRSESIKRARASSDWRKLAVVFRAVCDQKSGWTPTAFVGIGCCGCGVGIAHMPAIKMWLNVTKREESSYHKTTYKVKQISITLES